MMRHALPFFVLMLFGATVSAQTVVRGPYIQQTAPDAATVVWRTDVATQGVVRFGATSATLDQTSATSADGTQHEVRVTGLSPATRYFYSVGTPGATLAGGDDYHFFATSPTTGTPAPVRIWVVGDSGNGSSRQLAVRDAMFDYVGAQRPELFVHVGDMAYDDGEDFEFQANFFDIYQDVLRNTVTWPAMGNHEGRTADSSTQTGGYYDAYALPTAGEAGGLASGTEAYYSFDHGNIHFIVLDSHDSPREATGTMGTWLTQDLASTNAEWIIAFWHHPPYSKGSHDSDTEGSLRAMREELVPILEAGGVDLVLAGHSHIYERSYLVNGAYDTPTTAAGYILDPGDGSASGDGSYMKPAGASEGAVYIVAGHGGAGVGGPGNHPLMYFSELANGSCIVDVDGSLLRVVNVRRDGQVTDEFSMIRGDGVFLLRPASEERIEAGSDFTIRWLATDTRAVKLEYSPDDGANWTEIAAEVAGATEFAWTVPTAVTTEGRIRVTDVDDPTRTATNARPFVITDELPQVVVPYGGIWKYDDDGGDYPDEAWTLSTYDDSAWKSGAGELGYGDGDEVTELLDADPNVPSVLFRHTIALERPVAAAVFDAIFDDAIAIWVNGELVHSENMAAVINFDDYAASSSDDNMGTRKELGAVNPFVAGDNVIAVMVKQTSATSSDLSFDLQLTLTYEPRPPEPGIDMGGGTTDGGSSTGSGDSGTSSGGTDASSQGVSTPDGGAADAGRSINGEGAGCNCSTGPGNADAAFPLLVMLGGLALVRRRRTLRAS